jgi:Pyruvate/2-oxoacid:ferredoxin oxidoreductase delta subunit
MAVRKIVKIDEEKCDGCGLCVPSCAEGAIQIIDGKAKLVSEIYCDGLGACLGTCPQDAITIEEREADEFNEAKAMAHVAKMKAEAKPAPAPHPPMGGCPGALARSLQPAAAPKTNGPGPVGEIPSGLVNWPIQLMLVPPSAPYFQGADILLAADCVPFAYPDFHRKILAKKPLVIGCPKLDDARFYVEKLAQLIQQSNIRSLTVAVMEVPCCTGLIQIAEAAIERSGRSIPLKTITFGIQGGILDVRGDTEIAVQPQKKA